MNSITRHIKNVGIVSGGLLLSACETTQRQVDETLSGPSIEIKIEAPDQVGDTYIVNEGKNAFLKIMVTNDGDEAIQNLKIIGPCIIEKELLEAGKTTKHLCNVGEISSDSRVLFQADANSEITKVHVYDDAVQYIYTK